MKNSGFLLAHDTNDYTRFEAAQGLYKNLIIKAYQASLENPIELFSGLTQYFSSLLEDKNINLALLAKLFSTPSLGDCIQFIPNVEVDLLFTIHTNLKKYFAATFGEKLYQLYLTHHSSERYEYTPEKVAKRNFKNLCLSYLIYTQGKIFEESQVLLLEQFYNANNMTDTMGALQPLSHLATPEREQVLDYFYDKWQHEPLVVLKWLSVQAMSLLPDTLDTVRNLLKHKSFDMKNPNKVYALIGGFCAGNPARFHDKHGEGYELLSETVLALNKFNPQVAARMLQPLTQWPQFDTNRQKIMIAELEKLGKAKNLSKNIEEIVSKSLASKP